jgi:hypothetical protein
VLRDVYLYCSTKKSQFFITELDFLGHHISACGVEVDKKKIDKIHIWPVSKNAKDVWKFLGLVQYLAFSSLPCRTPLYTDPTDDEGGVEGVAWMGNTAPESVPEYQKYSPEYGVLDYDQP